MASGPEGHGFTSRFVVAEDGLRLHARDYGSANGVGAIVCLPGLARTAADFDPLARALVAADPARRVVALDYRGRGLSDRDPDPTRYDLAVESADIRAVLAALGIARAVVVGTSRGGLHTFVLAGTQPELLEGVVLNDIGPVLEPSGLARIQSYVGKLPTPASWEEAVAALRHVAGATFTALSDADWAHYTRTTYEEDAAGRLVARYDPALAVNLARLDPGALPVLWDAFDALAAIPLLVIRGENSDLLSTATAEEMVRRHPDGVQIVVAGQGHAPLLTDEATTGAIEAFVRRCQRSRPPSPDAQAAALGRP